MFACAPRVRLHVGVLGAEDLLRAVDRRLLDNVRKFAPAVITLARIAFGILVRKNRAHRLKHGLGHKILRRDQLKPVRLPPNLVVDRAC